MITRDFRLGGSPWLNGIEHFERFTGESKVAGAGRGEILVREVGEVRVAFDQDGPPSGRQSGDPRGSAAGKGVKHDPVRLSERPKKVRKQQDRLSRGVAIRISYLRNDEESVEPWID